MNTPPTKFALMRANREKQKQIAAYGRLLDAIANNALGTRVRPEYTYGRPTDEVFGIARLNVEKQAADNRRFVSALRGTP